MPVLIPVKYLQPGMRVAEDFVYHDKVLLERGLELGAALVERLRRQLPDQQIQVGDPILDDLVRFEDHGPDRAVAVTVKQKIGKSMEVVTRRVADRMSIGALNFQQLQQSVSEVIDYISGNPVTAALIANSFKDSHYLSEHAGNVFYLSMLLGSAVRQFADEQRARQTHVRRLSDDRELDLLPLGIGAMLADIAMFDMERVLSADYQLTNADRMAIRAHPIRGAEMLPDNCPSLARMVVLNHHESVNGEGYPGGVAGMDLHVFARIVRIADTYDAATATYDGQKPKSAARVLWEMSAGPLAGQYDQHLVRMFAQLVQPFPIGAKLYLNDGRIGVVVGFNSLDSFAPRVIAAFDHAGNRLADDQLEKPFYLDRRPDLRISSFDGESLDYIYEIDRKAPAKSQWGSLFDLIEYHRG